jgi:hypothetical protein
MARRELYAVSGGALNVPPDLKKVLKDLLRCKRDVYNVS